MIGNKERGIIIIIMESTKIVGNLFKDSLKEKTNREIELEILAYKNQIENDRKIVAQMEAELAMRDLEEAGEKVKQILK